MKEEKDRRRKAYSRKASQLLPQSPDGEKGLLGSIMLDAHRSLGLCSMHGITANHFFIPAHATMYKSLLQLWAEDKLGKKEASTRETVPVDFITLTQHLRDNGLLDQVGGAAYVTECMTFIPTAANALYYIEILKEKYSYREAIVACDEAIERFYEEQDIKPVESIAILQTRLSSIAAEKSITSVTVEAFAKVEAQIKDRMFGDPETPLGLPTGVPAWDKALHGLFEGEMLVLASRPGAGKTAALEIAIETQLEAGHHVLVIEKDMRVDALIGRMAARRCRVPYTTFLTNHATSGQLTRFQMAIDELKQYLPQLHLYNVHSLTAEDLDAIVRREIAQHKIRSWWFDHFLTLTVNKRNYGNLTEGLSEASILLRKTISETGVPGNILVHLNREADKSPRPHSGQLKYCDQLYADCDKLLLLWSEQDAKDLKPDEMLEVTLTIDKNRFGRTGDELMHFKGSTMSFHQI